jgi:hypothetical protein
MHRKAFATDTQHWCRSSGFFPSFLAQYHSSLVTWEYHKLRGRVIIGAFYTDFVAFVALKLRLVYTHR